jgi:hypothetical protein
MDIKTEVRVPSSSQPIQVVELCHGKRCVGGSVGYCELELCRRQKVCKNGSVGLELDTRSRKLPFGSISRSSLKVLSWARHRTKSSRHPPEQASFVLPLPIAQHLTGVVPFIMPEVVVRKLQGIDWWAGAEVFASQSRVFLDCRGAFISALLIQLETSRYAV